MARVAKANRVAVASRVAKANRVASTRGWTPKQLSPLVWHDCSLLTAGAVASLPDQSGNGFNPTEATNQPVATAAQQNGLTTLNFTAASSHKLSYAGAVGGFPTLAANITYALVCTASSDASSYMVGGSSAINSFISRFNATSLEWYENGATNNYVLSTVPGTNFHLIIVQHSDGGNADARFDRVPVATFPKAVRTTMLGQALARLGCASNDSAFSTFKLGELVLINSAISAANIGLLELYLSNKWNIHP